MQTINESNWLTFVMEYLELLHLHYQIAGTDVERKQLESLIKYLNKTN